MSVEKGRVILAADIGNTSTHWALMRDGKVLHAFRMSTQGFCERRGKKAVFSKEKANRLLSSAILEKWQKAGPEAVVLASVVPVVGLGLQRWFKRRMNVKCRLVGRDMAVPIVNRYSNPKQVGVDRLLNALAAYDVASREAIVVDFGTAITFDVISRRGEYLGGVIAPGIEVSLTALFEKTALLPRVRMARPRHLVGRNTVESIRVGCAVGIGGLCDRILSRLKAQMKADPVVIATGGYAHFMSMYSNEIRRIEPMLIFKGIYLAYKSSASPTQF